MRLMITVTALTLFLACGSTAVCAGDPVSREEIDQLQREVSELKSLVSDMKSIIRHQSKTIQELQEHQGEEQHEEHGKEEAGHTEKDGHDSHGHDAAPASLEGFLKAIKPQISVTGDFVANLSDDHHIRTGEDRFDLRGVDITFTGEIDDVARAVFNAAYHDDDLNLEEAYLDVFDILPFETDLKLGKFRANFGLLNPIHPHALPQVDYPAVYRQYLGHEGYIDEGVGIGGELPSLWGTPIKYTLQALNGNPEHRESEDGHGHGDGEYERLKDYDDIVYVGRLQNTFGLGHDAAVKWGLSGMTGRFEDDDAPTFYFPGGELPSHFEDHKDSPRFYYQGGDLSLTWHPFEDKYKRILWQSEFIAAQIEEGSSWEHSYGFYSFLDYRFAPKWLAGLRYDYAELPRRSRDHLTEYSAYVTHDYTESNRLRVQYKHANRNYDKETNEIFFQWVFTLGAHQHLEDEGHDDH